MDFIFSGVPFDSPEAKGPVILELPIDKIRRPLLRTRSNDPEKVKELMESIREIGLQVPVIANFFLVLDHGFWFLLLFFFRNFLAYMIFFFAMLFEICRLMCSRLMEFTTVCVYSILYYDL